MAERWTLEVEEHRSSGWYAAAIHDEKLRVVACVPQAQPTWDETEIARVEERARLIAAAPDLLAACEAYQDWTDASERAVHDNSLENLDAEIEASDRFDNLRLAAIAKARGEASGGR